MNKEIVIDRKMVIVETPFAQDFKPDAKNEEYARNCMRDSFQRNEAPVSTKLLYTQPCVILNNSLKERTEAVVSADCILEKAGLLAVYVDNGISKSITYSMYKAQTFGVPVEFRWIGDRDHWKYLDTGNVVIDTDGKKTLISDCDFLNHCLENPYKYALFSETVHEDEDYSYNCGKEDCRCEEAF